MTQKSVAQRTYVVLHNVRSAYNVGSVFRTADGAGVATVYLVGYTPTPIDRFGRKRADIHKAALGSEDSVPWKHIETLEACLEELGAKGIDVVLVEQMKGAVSYQEYTCLRDTAFVFGNEREGVPETARALARAVIEIPMQGEKESLNISVAVGIILYHFVL